MSITRSFKNVDYESFYSFHQPSRAFIATFNYLIDFQNNQIFPLPAALRLSTRSSRALGLQTFPFKTINFQSFRAFNYQKLHSFQNQNFQNYWQLRSSQSTEHSTTLSIKSSNFRLKFQTKVSELSTSRTFVASKYLYKKEVVQSF